MFDDERGFFYESWNERRFRHDLISAGVPASEAEALQFKQDNHSRSSRGVLRGLHPTAARTQGQAGELQRGRQWRTQQLPSSGGDLQPDGSVTSPRCSAYAPDHHASTTDKVPCPEKGAKLHGSDPNRPDLSPSVPCLTLIQHCNILRA